MAQAGEEQGFWAGVWGGAQGGRAEVRLASGGLGWGLDPPGAPCLSPLVRVGLSLPIWKEGCLSLPYLAVVSVVELTRGPGMAGSGRLLFLFFIIIVINYIDLNFPPQPFFFTPPLSAQPLLACSSVVLSTFYLRRAVKPIPRALFSLQN